MKIDPLAFALDMLTRGRPLARWECRRCGDAMSEVEYPETRDLCDRCARLDREDNAPNQRGRK